MGVAVRVLDVRVCCAWSGPLSLGARARGQERRAFRRGDARLRRTGSETSLRGHGTSQARERERGTRGADGSRVVERELERDAAAVLVLSGVARRPPPLPSRFAAFAIAGRAQVHFLLTPAPPTLHAHTTHSFRSHNMLRRTATALGRRLLVQQVRFFSSSLCGAQQPPHRSVSPARRARSPPLDPRPSTTPHQSPTDTGGPLRQ
jgi:hypothetical protein